MAGESSLAARGETFFLNLRFMLIVTVFAGNAIEPLIGTLSGMHSLYLWIFSFHMPLFVLVTGYFAGKSLTGAAGRKVLLQIGLQYLIFQTLYSALDVSVFRVSNIHHSFFAPYLLLWFLASHACWRLLMLGMGRWSKAAQIIFAVTAGVAVGYLQLDGVWFSISRTFVYLPFFVIGYHFSFEALARIYTKTVKIAAAAASVLLLLILGMLGSKLPLGWLYGSMTYMQLDAPEWYAGVYRLGMYGLQLAASLAFLGWVPYRLSRMTDWGRRTLYVFLLHGFVVRLAAVSGIYTYLDNAAGASALLLCAVSFTVLLAQPAVKRVLHPLVEPSVDWMITLQRAALRRSL
ncbi:fucose 4-O-acetylase [Paenibacillus helianthi]|uniref:Fucose 4-O-acetylase n=1 Tax=Paenibacillus helianthi TaxID=1349432 RepID=A0ABX3EFQ1_9BACL|nr:MULTISPECIES: fucose 4-O-acetylase [Paenibacillus]OKP79090.1 fucose 4-O-acetylase [Paenibacillus helianthi]OKP92224.1 fucose 4-O-acetylase [Paenibacillus sp. P32E]